MTTPIEKTCSINLLQRIARMVTKFQTIGFATESYSSVTLLKDIHKVLILKVRRIV
jgi:hypothetical protein